MSDVRALMVGSDMRIGDGAYLERADAPGGPLEEMLRAWVARLVPAGRKAAARFVGAVNALEPAARASDEAALKSRLRAAAIRMRKQGLTDVLLAEVFAVVREASRRTLDLRHHDVQLLAARALLRGKIAEQATGEGKTLAAALAACAAAATGATVHIVTVNDYLASRDCANNAPLFDFLGLTVGNVKQDMQIPERRVEYAHDIVYVSNKELVFDYLKDRIALAGALHSHGSLRRLHGGTQQPAPLLRGLHVAIVDEADSVLIDEARTPLIISETLPDEFDAAVYERALETAGLLSAREDYAAGEHRDLWLTQAGLERVRKLTADFRGVWASALWRRELVQQALSALHAFHRDRHYIVADGKVQIVDEFTGRVMPDRTWERGLHQMIEAKEGCEITGQRKTLAQITYQRFFGRYLLLGGMTGTAKEVEPEIKRVYALSAVRIPTHKPVRRVRLPDRVFRTSEERWREVARRCSEVAAAGRAVLVGTRSVEASELLSKLLEEQGVRHMVLNARQDKSEADAVAAAGQSGRITVATNMAGRGTDIKLSADVANEGGLHVILTEFHESARVDRQLFGRCARQGDPGTVEAIVCLQDELFSRYAPYASKLLARWYLRDSCAKAWLFTGLVIYAQWRAERQGRRIRLQTIKQDRKRAQALGFAGSGAR